MDGDTRLDDDVAGRSWVSYAYERIDGIGESQVAVQPYAAMADKGPGDYIWEVIETRLTPDVEAPSARPSFNWTAHRRRSRR